MNKNVIQILVEEGAVKKVKIVADGAAFHVDVVTNTGSTTATTLAGSIKTWATLDSAARWVRSLGLGKAQLELTNWQPGQKALNLQ
jgi:hypothetical protein|tara:strand:- start:533 stop:790 length:258 start_codon:yes stop_codon:yes gene_type:complete